MYRERPGKEQTGHDFWLMLGKILLHLLMWAPVVFLILFWQQLPDRVPTHYSGANNMADRWSGKSSLIVLPLFAFLILYMPYFFSAYMVRLSGTDVFYGKKAKGKVTEADLQYGRRLILKMIAWMMDWCLLLFAAITFFSAAGAESLPGVVIYGIIVIISVQFCYYMVLLFRKRKKILAS